MAYSDYGAFVYLNGERRFDKEDVAGFASDEETFGCDSSEIPSGLRIFKSLLHARQNTADNKDLQWVNHIHHGVMGDGDIRVICHKQGLPEVYEVTENGLQKIEFCSDEIDYYDYESILFEYKGYKFYFESGSPYRAVMTEPNGDVWECKYDYLFGAGF